MKKNLLTYICVLATATLVGTTSCNKLNDFGTINTSPNSPALPNTTLLFSNVERYLGTSGILTSNTTRLYSQWLSETLYTSESRFATNTYDFSGVYNSPLQDLNYIIQLNTDAATKSATYVLGAGTNNNQIAVARILKAFYYLNMTDKWGDIPYSEALQGLVKPNPKYDTQQSIYADLFKELKAAIAQFDNTANIKGDILFTTTSQNNAAQWKKFANTIRLNMALRLSKVDPATGKAEFNAAIADGVLTSNNDNIVYNYLAEAANQAPIYNNYEVAKRYDYAVSKTLVDQLNTLSDPRLPIYAEKNSAGIYAGMPYGLTQANAGAGYSPGSINSGVVVPGNVSLIGAKYRAQAAPAPIYTYASVLFDLAEGVKLGWYTTGLTDATYYVNAIQASMTQQGVAATAATTYLAQPGVVYDGTVKQIITQKWIAGYLGYADEAYNDFRRTGFPTLSPGPAPQSDNGQIPRRLNYPTTEKTLNTANYNAAVARQGADVQSTHVWWDK